MPKKSSPEIAKTPAQRQEALRARRAAQGLTEVRGIYLPPGLHKWLKLRAKEYLSKRKESSWT